MMISVTGCTYWAHFPIFTGCAFQRALQFNMHTYLCRVCVWIFRKCDSCIANRTGEWWMHEFLGVSLSACGKAHRNFANGKCAFFEYCHWIYRRMHNGNVRFARAKNISLMRVGKMADFPYAFVSVRSVKFSQCFNSNEILNDQIRTE